jgi:hypothetical protein
MARNHTGRAMRIWMKRTAAVAPEAQADHYPPDAPERARCFRTESARSSLPRDPDPLLSLGSCADDACGSINRCTVMWRAGSRKIADSVGVELRHIRCTDSQLPGSDWDTRVWTRRASS